MMMLIQSICIGFRGLAIPISVETEINDSAAILVLSWNLKKFRMLINIDFPSSIADKIVEKSSSHMKFKLGWVRFHSDQLGP